MSRIVCYVEGAGDKLAMESLLRPLIEAKLAAGITIEFFETPGGDRKKAVLLKGPEKAVNILRNISEAQVALIPDLFPKNRGFPHETSDELRHGILQVARKVVARKKLDPRLLVRLHVFCFKHDMEALLLASETTLAGRLGVTRLTPTWIRPVEAQDLDHPPKRVIEELFKRHGRRYKETVDAPAILAAESYASLAERCPQCFAPFVEWLESL